MLDPGRSRRFASDESNCMSVGVISEAAGAVSAADRPLPLEIRTFGRFRLFDPRSNREIPFRSRKALALLCYLAMANDGTVTRERAMELLWGSRGEEQARA